MGLYAAAFAGLLLLFFGVSAWLQNLSTEKQVIPDEKAAAASLLAQQLSGPRYFRVPEGGLKDRGGVTVKTAVEPHISTVAARSQVEGIVHARELSAGQAAKVNALIDQLAEAPASRVVGEEHVNLLRLNLALDALR
jgi:hypothetical protein